MTEGAGFATTVHALIATQARANPAGPALVGSGQTLSYGELIDRVDRVAAGLAGLGVARGDRVAMLSENSIDYALLQLACAKIGAIVACQNWRLSRGELAYCVALVEPTILVVSPRLLGMAEVIAAGVPIIASDAIGGDGPAPSAAQPEDPLLIIYTSGTTGMPKAATISHRAEVARMAATRLDLGIAKTDGYIAWAPMFHMGGSEHLLATLMSGGCGFILDGFDAAAIADILADHPIGWLMLVPATIQPLLQELEARSRGPRSVRAVGCMADLVPGTDVAAITRAVDAPYLNSFGATETGMPPLSGNMIPVGVEPSSLSKSLSVLAELRLVGSDGQDVPDGEVGEAWVRGPTVFSGYWNAPDANAECFAHGWYRMGDLFRHGRQGYDFVGRSKYLIKSGGENIYPAEIERLLLADPRVADAIVVKAPDANWGEVPVAVIARNDPALLEEHVFELLDGRLAGYKKPRHTLFVELSDLPRNVSGKIIRETVELLVCERLGLGTREKADG